MSTPSVTPTRHLLRDQSGAAMVEFALVLPMTLLLVIGILDIGKAVNYWIDETHLANTGARYAVVDRNPGETDGLTLQQYIKSRSETNQLQSASEVCVSFPDGSSEVGDPVEVAVTYMYDWLPFVDNAFGVTETPVTASATMRLEAPPTAYDAGCA